MIVVHVSESGITVDGHAGYAENGKDIVCSAVSILTWSLVNSLQSLTRDYVEYEKSPGHMKINYKNLSEQGKILVDSFFIGISEIIRAYGERYVQLI